MGRSTLHSCGFTLIELLVVIGIIALLIGIMLPVLNRVRAQAQFVMCKSQIRQQLAAHAMYANDWRDAKPPLYQKRTRSVRIDWVSPDIKWNNLAVGQGLLVEGKYLTLDALLDPSEYMTEDVERDRVGWKSLSNSGSSYVYFWRHASEVNGDMDQACVGATYQGAVRQERRAMIMDLNAEEGHPYLGEYAGRPWVAHKRLQMVNIGYVDGSVQDAPAADVKLKYPGGSFEELEWFDAAHSRY